MRLLVTTTLKLVYFPDNAVPQYAILSHIWGINEVMFEDFNLGGFEGKAGYHKIQRSSEIAAQDRFSHIWIDTCCIDKSSSAELSESINSMYRYYKKANICYAYLEDVPFETPMREDGGFAASRWFTRGWTLQELIAPTKVVFLSTDWRNIGTKNSLDSVISRVTGIGQNVLTNANHLQEVSVAKRMSWAAKRETTREEDIAYCLLGIFDVNMPLHYGEGRKAFIRLQEEIMKESTDQSLFTWSPSSIPSSDTPEDNENDGSILASHPLNFASASNIVPYRFNVGPYSMTNRGLHIKLPVLPGKDVEKCVAILACHVEWNFFGPIGISLLRSKKKRLAYSSEPMLCLKLSIALKQARQRWYPYTFSRRSPARCFQGQFMLGSVRFLRKGTGFTSTCWIHLWAPWRNHGVFLKEQYL